MSPEGSLLASRLLPRDLDVGRLDRFAGVVAPAVARVGDDRGDVGVGQLLPRRHRRGLAVALDPVQHRVYLRGLGTVDDLRAVERRKRGRRALAGRLVAGDAVRRVDFLAARDQILHVPYLAGIVAGGGESVLLGVDPLAVVVLRLDL